MTDSILAACRDFRDRHPGGCCLHIALEDGNLKNGDLKWCMAQATLAGHQECDRLACSLFALSLTQRRKVYNQLWRTP